MEYSESLKGWVCLYHSGSEPFAPMEVFPSLLPTNSIVTQRFNKGDKGM